MKVTKRQLRRIIKEETARRLNENTPGAAGIAAAGGGTPADQGFAAAADDDTAGGQWPARAARADDARPAPDTVESDILDAIQMLESLEDSQGTLFYVINRLYAALEKI
jgi:hypothetical protein